MRILKRIFELVFIFILPLVFCFCSFKKEITNTYDNNNNLLTTENNYTWDFPFNDFKDSNHYVNLLDYNQFKPNINTSYGVLNNGLYSLDFNSTYSGIITIITFSLNSQHKYYLEFKKNSELINNTRLYCSDTGSYLNTADKNWSLIVNGYQDFNLNLYTTNGVIYDGSFYFTIIDLTKMFGIGYEPNNFTNYQSLIKYSDNSIDSFEIKLISSSRISLNYEMNYTFWGKLFNDVLIDTLKFNDVFVVRFASSYIVLVIFMVFAYHLLIWPLDLLFRILFFKERL